MVRDVLYLLQTLTTLSLRSCQIGAKGAQVIVQALERNQVRYIFSHFIPISRLLYLSQTLIALMLEDSDVRAECAQAIRRALQRNKNR